MAFLGRNTDLQDSRLLLKRHFGKAGTTGYHLELRIVLFDPLEQDLLVSIRAI